MNESLEVLLLGPREWRPLFHVRRLWQVEALYWGHYLARFAPLDIWLQTRGLGRSRDDFRFGETPWATGLELLKLAEVGPEDTFYDLGAGRGKMVFLAALASGCQAVGIELLGGYNYVSRRLARWLKIENAVFRDEDFLRTDLSPASVVYLAGTTWSAETRERLGERLDTLSPGCRVLSVSHECKRPRLELVGESQHLFSWGRAKVYRYRVSDWMSP